MDDSADYIPLPDYYEEDGFFYAKASKTYREK